MSALSEIEMSFNPNLWTVTIIQLVQLMLSSKCRPFSINVLIPSIYMPFQAAIISYPAISHKPSELSIVNINISHRKQ